MFWYMFCFLLVLLLVICALTWCVLFVYPTQFAVLLAVVFILMIAGGIAAYVLRNEVSGVLCFQSLWKSI